MGNKIEDTLQRIKELKDSEGFREIEDYLRDTEGSKYFLNEVMTDERLNEKSTEFKKYILKGFDSEFINTRNLDPDKPLYQNLKNIISTFLGDDYLQIVFFENRGNQWRENETELFNLIFKKTFATKKNGKIKVIKLDDCTKGIAMGEINSMENHRMSVEINCVYQKYFNYEGHGLKNENVLFYGFNIEENPYLLKLFESNPPKKLLNIIPVSNRNSFLHDNVD